jgi:hypothetical protein
MDPYLEGYLWSDVHQALAGKIRQQLTPLLRPKYVARLAIRIVEDAGAGLAVNIIYPDVEILKPYLAPAPFGATAVATSPVTPSLRLPVERVKLVSVEVRDAAQNELVTSIEILSPVNKREPGLAEYREKRFRLQAAGVNLLEIDLLRQGKRPLTDARIPTSPYLVTLTRPETTFLDLWPISLTDNLPRVLVPLRPPDPDVVLDLQQAFTAVYDEAAYDLSVDYSQLPPPPALSPETLTWLQTLLAAWQQG